MSSFSSSASTSLLWFSSSIRADATASPPSMPRVSGRRIISSAVSWRARSSRRTSNASCRASGVVVCATASIAVRTRACWLSSCETTSPWVFAVLIWTFVTWVMWSTYPQWAPGTRISPRLHRFVARNPNGRAGSGGDVSLRAEGGLGPVGHAYRLEDAGQVCLDGALGDTEAAGDLLVGQSLPDEVEDFTLTGGQPVGGSGRRLLLPADIEQDACRLRVQRRLPCRRHPYGVGDLCRVTVLEQVAGRACLECVEDALAVGERRQDDDVDVGRVGQDAPGCFDSVDLGHRQVHQIDVRRHRRQQRVCLIAVGRRTDDLDVRLGTEQLRQALPDDGMVVDDRHADHGTGTSTRTVVPLPGTESTRTSPPALATRSRSDRRPTWPSATCARIVSSSKPTPSSVTSSSTASLVVMARTCRDVACACVSTLRTASCAARQRTRATSSRTGSRKASMSSDVVTPRLSTPASRSVSADPSPASASDGG